MLSSGRCERAEGGSGRAGESCRVLADFSLSAAAASPRGPGESAQPRRMLRRLFSAARTPLTLPWRRVAVLGRRQSSFHPLAMAAELTHPLVVGESRNKPGLLLLSLTLHFLQTAGSGEPSSETRELLQLAPASADSGSPSTFSLLRSVRSRSNGLVRAFITSPEFRNRNPDAESSPLPTPAFLLPFLLLPRITLPR